ncbi:MAG: RNA methyltransferase [Acidimicrobiales bacterium]
MNGSAPVGALSAANARIKRLRRLSGRRSSRSEDGVFVVEGAVLVREAVAAGLQVEGIYVDAGHGALVAEFDETGLPVFTVTAGVLASVLPAVTPQPVCAVVASGLERPAADVLAAASASGRPVLALVDLADPGNAGTLLRAAEASGCAGVVLCGIGVDPYGPKVVRASAASLFRLPFAIEPDVATLMELAASAGCPTFAAVARDGVAHLDADLGGAAVIVLGNEAHGLADDVVDMCDAGVTVTMDGPAESLNVAMAGTVLAFEAMRQRHARG